MAASVQCRHQDRSLGMVMKEVDGDLATFLEMRKREKESNSFVQIHNSDGFDDSIASSNPDCFTETLLKMSPADNFLDAETQQSDYDWLLTPPRTPSFPSSEMSVQSASSQIATSSALPTAQISKPENPSDVPSSLNDKSAQPLTSTRDASSVSRNRNPSLARQKSSAPRSATPTGRSTLPAPSRPSRSSTPTPRGIAASSKPMAPPVRSSTPTRVAARSATPPARSSIPSSTTKSASRSATPTIKSSTSSSATVTSAPSGRSSSVSKTVPTMSKNMGSRVGIVPMVKSRPKTVSDVPVISSDAPSNLKMTMPKRPVSASRGRNTASALQFSSSNLATARSRQKSCSPARGRVKDSPLDTAKAVLSRSRGYSNGSDDVNPVLIGTKMVERVVNMRKLAPPKHGDDDSHDNSSGKSSASQDNSGFGRSLSKKSLDMAIRHMDIRRSISGNLKTIVTSISAAASSRRRTGSSKTSTASASSDSPLATSSNTSFEPSVHNICHVLDSNGVDVNDTGSEREFSPSNYQN